MDQYGLRARLPRGTYLDDLVHLLAIPLIGRRHIAFFFIRTSVAVRVGV
jgi:hypothetical protein